MQLNLEGITNIIIFYRKLSRKEISFLSRKYYHAIDYETNINKSCRKYMFSPKNRHILNKEIKSK